MQLRLSLGFILFYSVGFGQSLKTEIDTIYSFRPSKLSSAEQELKLPPLDKFWSKVKSDTASYLPALRNELLASNHNPFFYFDGSELLLSLTKSALDNNIAAKAIAKCDLDDINQKEFVRTLNDLSNDGTDVTDAAMKILYDTGFHFYVPQHALDFEHGYCLSYMLLPEKPALYVDSLVASFSKVAPISQKSIIMVLWFTYSCKGDSLIKAAETDKGLSKEVRDYAKETIKGSKLNHVQSAMLKTLTKHKWPELRRESLNRFSDEAIDDLELATFIMRKESACH